MIKTSVIGIAVACTFAVCFGTSLWAQDSFGNYLPERVGKSADEKSTGLIFQADRELLYDFDSPNPLAGVVIAGGRGELSSEHFMTRSRSLLWHTDGEGSLTFKAGMHLQPSDPKLSRALAPNSYHLSLGLFLESRNEQEAAPSFRLEMIGDHGQVLYQVPFYLHKTGWNILDVKPDLAKGTFLGSIRIIREKGPALSVYVDNVLLSHAEPGIQTMGILAPVVYYERKQAGADGPVPDAEKRVFQTIAERVIPPVSPVAKLPENKMKAFEDWRASWKIERKGVHANGEFPLYYYRTVPGDHRVDSDSYSMYNANAKLCKTTGELGFAYAQCQDPAQKARLRSCLVDIVRLAATYGGMPNAWYNGRGFAEGVYYGRDALEAEGLLEPITRQLIQQYGVDKSLENPPIWDKPPTEPGIAVEPKKVEFLWQSSADDLNTGTKSKLLCLLVGPDNGEKADNLKKFSQWYSRVALAYAPYTNGTLKPDGSWFHHGGNRFDGYGWKAAFEGASEMLYWCSGTPFHLEKEAHERLFHMGEILQKVVFRDASYGPPDHIQGGTAAYGILLNLARSGTPDGSSNVAPQFASALLGLIQKPGAYDQESRAVVDTGSAIGTKLKPEAASPITQANRALADGWAKTGIRPSNPTDALVTLSYAGIQFRRVEDWSLVLWGVSKYFYYNQYSRPGFLFYSIGGLGITGMDHLHASWGNGTRQNLDGRHDPVVNMTAGYNPSYAPCVTAVEAEWPDLTQTYYQAGTDVFVGGVTLGSHYGAFVQNFDSRVAPGTYSKTVARNLSFRKSYFTFDRWVVALGRSIGAGKGDHVFTGILQERPTSKGSGVVVGGSTNTWKSLGVGVPSEEVDWAEAQDRSLGVWIFPGQKIRGENGDLSSGTRSGPMTRLYVDHGSSVNRYDGSYALVYAIHPEQGAMANLAKSMKSATPPVRILQNQEDLQVVQADAGVEQTETGYVFQKPAETQGAGPVVSADAPCLVMTQVKNKGTQIELAVSDPDLHMDRTEANPFGYSLPTKIRLCVKGHWSLKQVLEEVGVKRPEVTVQSLNGGNTVLQVTLADGLSAQFILAAQ